MNNFSESLRTKAVRYLAGCVEEILARQDQDGAFWPDQGRAARYPTEYQQFAYQPLALLYKLDDPANPWRGERRLLDAAVRSLRNNLRIEDGQGRFLMSSHDRAPSHGAANWRSFSFLRTWELLREDLDPGLASACEASLRRALGAMEACARASVAEERFAKNHNVRNHPVMELTATLALARHFGEQKVAAWCVEQFERVCAVQHPAGLWFEHNGPVIAYQHMTMSGLSHYATLTGSPAAREALRKALRFFRVFYYPNGHPCEILDGRVRYTGFALSMLPAVWAHEPEGRALLHLILDRLLQEGLGPGYQTHGGWLGLFHLAQFICDLPPEAGEPPAPAALVGEGVHEVPLLPVRMVRQGPWTVYLSGFTRPEMPGSRWALDYQAPLSVFHAKQGLLVGGGGGKRQAALSLFTGGSRPLGLPCLAVKGSVETLGPAAARLSLEYPGFHATLEVSVREGAVHLAACAQETPEVRARAGPLFLQLPFLLKGEGEVTTGAGKRYKLDMQQELSSHEIGDALGRAGRFMLSGLSGARALLLLKPYNTHWRDGWCHEEKHVGVVAQPLEDGQTRRLTLRV